MIIVHGDNIVASRKHLRDLVEDKKKHGDVISVDASTLKIPVLENLLGAQELFSTNQTLVIDNLFSLTRSKQKSDLLTMLSKASRDIILWEKRPLRATETKLFSGAQIRLFRTSGSIFTFIESIRPGNAKQSIQLLDIAEEKDGIEICFALLSRQIRLLIQLKDHDSEGIPPFSVGKLKKQAENFTLPQLIKLYEKLTLIDEQEKTSKSSLSLRQKLDLLISGI